MTAIFKEHEADLRVSTKWWASRIAIYTALFIWMVVCLFPILWTITTSFKLAPDVMKGNLIPWWDFTPRWKGWESIGLSPRLIGEVSTVREEFFKRFWNSTIISISAALLAVILGSLAAYGSITLQLPVWIYEKLRHFVFLSQPNDLTACSSCSAIPYFIQIFGTVRQQDWIDLTIYFDGSAHCYLDYA